MAGKNENQEKNNDSSSEEDVEMESDAEDENSDDDMSDELCKELQQKVDDEPSVYEHRVDLIEALRKAGELEKLRSARREMQKIFPLTPVLWLEWIEDESKVMESPEERDQVEELYNQAVEDYPSVKVWLEFVQFAIGDMGRKGFQHPRDIFERALTSVGLHVTQGPIIWQAYREYETAVLAGLQPPGSIPTPERQKDIQAQTNRITSILKRQLAVPHQDIDVTFEEYEEFSDEVDPFVKKTYEKSKEKLKKLIPFEDALEKARRPRTAEYKSYIKHELKEGDPSRIQCMFERALIENCLAPDFWIRYGKYLDYELRSRSAILKMYKRAVRNCPWSVDLYLLHMRALERFQYRSHDLIKGKFEEGALGGNFSSGPDSLKVWTAYIDYMRRRMDWDEDEDNVDNDDDQKDEKEKHEKENEKQRSKDKKMEELRSTFDRAVEFLMANFGKDGDPNCTLLQYRARFEAKFGKNMEKVRECWNQILKQGFGNQYQMWLEYFNLERYFGDHKHCRKILQRALNSVTDWPEYIVETYLNFEREEGTLEQYEQGIERCEAQMARIEERKAKELEIETLKRRETEDISKWCKISVQRKRKKKCDLCGKGHERLSYHCDALQEPPLENVTPFKGKLDVLSNFYMCKLRFEGKEYASTEHLYQYYKAIESGREDLARKILLLDESRDVKLLSFNIKTAKTWFDRKGPLFDRILAAKLLYCPEYARALLDAEEVIAEAVPGDTYWSTGISKEELPYTKMEYWPGQNVMGKMHMKLREIIRNKMQGSGDSKSKVATLRELCTKVTEKDARLQEEEQKQKKARGYQKQREDRESLQKEQQKQRIQEKLYQPQTVTKTSPPGKRHQPSAQRESAPSKTDEEGFKVPPPPGFKPSTNAATGHTAPPPGYKHKEQMEPPTKKQKVTEDSTQPADSPTASTEKCKVFVSNLRFDTKEADLTPIFIGFGELKDIRLVRGNTGKIRGFGYVEFKNEASATAALALDRQEIDGRPMYVSECKPKKDERGGAFKFSTAMEKCKLFVRNLPLTTTKEALEAMFSQYGRVKEARLVTHKSGAPKGLAYVEYFQEDDASKAVVQADGQKVGDMEISVAISNPPSRKMPLNQRDQPSSFQPSLGGGKKEADRGGRAKTMLAFQPRSLHSKVPTSAKPAGGASSTATTAANGNKSGQSSESGGSKTGMSNADFRSFLLKK